MRSIRAQSSEACDEVAQAMPGEVHPSLAPKLKVWVVLTDQVQFGYGRAQLLRAIDDLGSIRKAAAQFGMSYRRVWGYLRELEAAAGFPFLERRVGGWGHGGTALTPAGRTFLTQYETFQQQVEVVVRQHFAACFAVSR
jgi:molybdate transport system regulatory protein